MTKVDTMRLQKNLLGINYPASKKDLIRNAEEYGADERILWMLKKIPNKQYETLSAVSQAMGEIK